MTNTTTNSSYASLSLEATRERKILNSEPVPDWYEAKATFQWGWELHWISFVVLFLGLAVYSSVRLVEASKRRHLREKVSRNVSYAVHSMIIVLGITRALALVVFPYEMTTNINNADVVIPLYVHRIVFGLGFPCFMAAFTLIQLTFTASIKPTPLTYSKLRKVRFLVLIIVGHFSVVIIADVITAFVENTSALFMVCTVYLLSMTLFTGFRITRSGYKVFRESSEHRRVTARPGLRDTQKPSIKRAKFNSKALRKVFIITVLTIFFCFALFALKIYDLVEVIEFTFILGKDKKVEPWPWFIHETLFRLTEFGLACTVLYAVSPFKKRRNPLLSFCCCCRKEEKQCDVSVEIEPHARERTGTNEMVLSSPPPHDPCSTHL